MTIIKLKRVYEDYENTDGLRVLVDRLWPRGVKKEDLHYDLWAKDIAPSSDLRKWFHENPDKNRDQFSFLYQKELSESEPVKKFITEIKQHTTVTLLYASKNEDNNHALILKQFLDKSMAE